MPVAPADWLVHKSVNDGEGGERDLGAPITDNILGNLFPQISSAEAAAGGSRVRKFFIENDHATDTAFDPEATIIFFPGAYTIELGWGMDDDDDDDASISGNLNGDLGGSDVTLSAVSDGADTDNLTAFGRTAAGAHVQATLTLNGTTPVNFSDDMAWVYAVVRDTPDGARTVTIRRPGPVSIGTIQPNQRHCFWWMDQEEADEIPMTLDDIAPAFLRGFWIRQTWPVNASPGSGFSMTFNVDYD